MDLSNFRALKHSNVIVDPYPRLGLDIWHNWSWLDKWALKRIKRKDYPNPWKAWRDGYVAAYDEMENKLVTHNDML